MQIGQAGLGYAGSMPTDRQSPWLFGPLPDLFFGAGLLYLVVISALIAGGSAARAAIPAHAAAYLLLIFSGAHYGATYLRVYENKSDRRTYRIFTVYGTLAMLTLLAGSLYSPVAGSLLITVYLTWSPWHYTGQNYGVVVMLLRRHGVEITPLAKRWLYASFILSFASVFLNFHFEGGIGQGDPLGYATTTSTGFQFVSLDLPGSIRDLFFPLVAIAYGVSVAMSGFLLSRNNSARAIAPAALLMLTQAVWFSIPHFGFFFGLGPHLPAFDLGTSSTFMFYFAFAALGHSLQYLWVTSYFARAHQRWRGYRSYFTGAFIFGNAAWAAPVIIFAPDALGRPDYDGGLALSVAAAVNLHHFILDGAIWKLRNPKVAAVLFRNQVGEAVNAVAAAGSPWRRRVILISASFFCMMKVLPMIEIDGRLPSVLQHRDHATASSILERAAFYGRDSSNLRAQLGNLLVQARDPKAAIPHFWRSLQLRPQAQGFARLGSLSRDQWDMQAGIAVWKLGLEKFPADFELNWQMGKGLSKLRRWSEALPYLEHAAELRPENEQTKKALELAHLRRQR